MPSTRKKRTLPCASPTAVRYGGGPEIATAPTGASQGKRTRHRPVATSQSRNVRSSLPDTRKRPPGLKETLVTQAVCPSKRRSSRPVATSQSRNVRSSLPDTRERPPGLKETLLTQAVCPSKRRTSPPVATSQSRNVRSSLHD